MVTDSDQADRLRAKRQALADERHQRELRETAGPRLVTIVNLALGLSLSVDDFLQQGDALGVFVWPKRIEDAPGLVAAYVDRPSAEEVLACFDRQIGHLTGSIGFHDKAYLGFARVTDIAPTSLLEIANACKDSVLFFVDRPKGAVLVDCYEGSRSPYSVAVQGDSLLSETVACFDKQ